MNQDFLDANPGDSALAARVRSYELAARMQTSIPESLSLDKETEATKQLYGLDAPATEGFGRNCLLARRLLERGVRFVQLIHGGAFGSPRINWDAHEDVVENHTKQAAILDKPVAGLLKDLKRAACSTTRWCCGRRSSAGRRSRRAIGGEGPRPPPARLHLLDGRGGPEEGLPLRRLGRGRLPAGRGRRRASTTSTPRSCTCSASTTSG